MLRETPMFALRFHQVSFVSRGKGHNEQVLYAIVASDSPGCTPPRLPHLSSCRAHAAPSATGGTQKTGLLFFWTTCTRLIYTLRHVPQCATRKLPPDLFPAYENV